MTWWDDKAVFSQRANRKVEADEDYTFSEREAHRAAAYTRDDLHLVVSYLSSLNRQVATIRRILIVFAVLILLPALILALKFAGILALWFAIRP